MGAAGERRSEMVKRRLGPLALGLAVAAFAAACGSTDNGSSSSAASSRRRRGKHGGRASAASTGAFKAAWIYVGPHNDGGWSQAHDEGRLYVQKALGSKVQTTFKENVPEGPQVAQVIEQLVRDGNKIIFATSFGYQDAMVAEAKKHPDVLFEQATGRRSPRTLPSTTARARTASTCLASPPVRRARTAMSATSCRSRSPRSSGTPTRSRWACRRRTRARRCGSSGRTRGSTRPRRRRPPRA